MSEESAIGLPRLEPEKPGSGWALGFMHLCAALAGFVVPASLTTCCKCGHYQGPLTACKSNCKNIATALEMYSSDNHGHYPATLENLTRGHYLKVIPTCPATRRATYVYHRSSEADIFRFACAGNNHARAYTGFTTSSNNFPRYNPEIGLIDHP